MYRLPAIIEGVVVYRRGRVKRAIVDAVGPIAALWIFWLLMTSVGLGGRSFLWAPILWSVISVASQVSRYRANPWLVRTSYHGLDLLDGQPMRLPWLAITSIYVSGERLYVTVGDPMAPEDLQLGKRRRPGTSTFDVRTPEINEVLSDLATRVPYLEIKHL